MGAFLRKLAACAQANDSLLCIGLDPDFDLLPGDYARDASGVVAFNQSVIEATSDLVCAYKPNLAFYEAMGSAGLRALERTLALIPGHIPTIGDAKRGDVPNTARAYARAMFGAFGFDSVTVNPYMGPDSLAPFLEWEDKGVWVLCRTSNAGAGAVQDLPVGTGAIEPLYERILRMLLDLPARADVGIVVGATSPAELARMRTIAPALPLLIPGLGTQGGEARTAVEAAETGPVVINSSRSILYGPDATVRERALRARDELNVYRRLPHAAADGHRPS